MLHSVCKAMAPHAVAMAKDRHGNLALQAAIRQTGTAQEKQQDRQRAEQGIRGNGGNERGRGGRADPKSPGERGSDSSGSGGGMNKTRRRNHQKTSRNRRHDSDDDNVSSSPSSQGSPSHGYNRIEHGESTTEPCRELVLALSPHVVPLALDWFGNRVVQALIESLPRVGPDADMYTAIVERLLSRKVEMQESKYAAFVLKKLNDAERDKDGDAKWAQNAGSKPGTGTYHTPSYPNISQYGLPQPLYRGTQHFGMSPEYGEYSRYGPGAASMLPLDANYNTVQLSSGHGTPSNLPPAVHQGSLPSNAYQQQGVQTRVWGRSAPASLHYSNPTSPSASGMRQAWKAPVAVFNPSAHPQQPAWPAAPQWSGPESGMSMHGEETNSTKNGIWSKSSSSPHARQHQQHESLPAQHALHPLSGGAQAFSASAPAWSPNQATPSQSPEDPENDRGQRDK